MLSLLATAGLLALAGYAYLSLIGLAAGRFILPRRWLPYWPLITPHLGWIALGAVAHPLNVLVPLRWLLWGLGVAAVAVLFATPASDRRRFVTLARRGTPWRESIAPLALGLGVYLSGMVAHVRHGALSHVVFDSDAERYAEVVAAMLAFPLGPRIAFVDGFVATPQGPPYWHMHALLTTLTGLDLFTTAMPSHMLMLSLAVPSVYLFARSALRASRLTATVAALLYALWGVPLIVYAFGFTHQASSLALVPFGLAALLLLRGSGESRTVTCAGLAAAMAIVSNYPATMPLVVAAGAALALAVLWRRRTAWPRLLGTAAGAVAGAACAHSLFLVYVWRHVATSLVPHDDVATRSMHVWSFVSAIAAFGTVPWDLFREVRSVEPGPPALSWPADGDWRTLLTVAAGAALVGFGMWALRARPARVSLLVVAPAAAVALLAFRWGAKWPYGEFKIASVVWFVLPCLAAIGAAALARRTRLGSVAAVVLLVCYAVGVGATQAHAHRFLALPWGAAIPERDAAAARAIVNAIPRGAAVHVSGRLTPPVAREWNGMPLAHARGASSMPAGVAYVRARWGGLITQQLLYDNRPPFGVVPRDSVPLNAPPGDSAPAYVLLDDADDPRLYGLLPSDLRHSAGTLRLYQRWLRPYVFGLPSTTDPLRLTVDGTTFALDRTDGLALYALQRNRPAPEPLPALRLPAYDLPGGVLADPFRLLAERQDGRAAPVKPSGNGGSITVGLQALGDAHIEVAVRLAVGLEVRRTLVVPPGLSWYTTPRVTWPATVTLTPLPAESRFPVRAIGALATHDGEDDAGERLERSSAGDVYPLITLAATEAADGLTLDAWLSYAGARELGWQTQLRTSSEVWARTPPLETALHPGPGHRAWRAALQPGRQLTQDASDGRQPARAPRSWSPSPGRSWLWLEFGPHDALLFPEAPLLELSTDAAGRVRLQGLHSASLVLPHMGEPRPAVPEPLAHGLLVKGTSEDLFYVENGRLRWVPSLEVLARRGIPWNLRVLDDAALWRQPFGLPLT